MNTSMPLLYNPDQKMKEQLIGEFVIRQKEFMVLINGLLSSSIQTSPQHYLIVGQRGMGKTTLLLRLKYAIEDNTALNRWLIPIKFSEEQYQIATLDRLWEEIADHLETADPAFDGLLAEMEQHEDANDYERIALDIMLKAIKKQKKRVLVMIDNLGDLFKKLGDIGNHRFREVLLSHTNLQLIGASSDMLEHTFSYDKPFFEFFQQITLQPINKENSFKLLENLGRQYKQEEAVGKLILNNPGKIEVLRRLTGGVPRTIALLFGIFIDNQQGSTFEDLLYLLDQVNSFYKHRMDDLKPQQQRIIDALAKAWDPISSKEILSKSKLNREGIETNQISSQLNVLADNQVVEVVPGRGKIKSYRIRERFFNIWYLMRYGKKQHKEEVLWLVRFLETWCSKKEIQEQAFEQLRSMEAGRYSPKAAYLKTMALYHAKGIETGQRIGLLEKTEDYLKRYKNVESAETIEKIKLKELDSYADALITKHDENHRLVRKDIVSLSRESAVNVISIIGQKLVNNKKSLDGIKPILQVGMELNDPSSFCLMGIALQKSQPKLAEECYKKSIERGDISALYNLGLFYHRRQEFDLAEKYYLQGVNEGSVDSMYNLALLYENRQDFDLAKEYYLMAANAEDVKAIYNLALLYHDKQEIQLAEKYYLIAIDKENIEAMFNLALLYWEDKKTELAEKYYLLAIDKGCSPAMYNLALLYSNRGEFSLAEKYYLMAIDKGMVEAMYNIALLYQPKDLDLAEKYYLMAIDGGSDSALFNLAELYREKKAFALAEKYYLMAIDKGHVNAMNNLGSMYWDSHYKFNLAEKYFKMAHALKNVEASYNLMIWYASINKTEEMVLLANDFLRHIEILEDSKSIFTTVRLLLIKKQYNFLLQEFQNPESQLMKYARPMYYVLSWFMKDEMPGEYEKTAPEMKETVDEIIQQIVAGQLEFESSVKENEIDVND